MAIFASVSKAKLSILARCAACLHRRACISQQGSCFFALQPVPELEKVMARDGIIISAHGLDRRYFPRLLPSKRHSLGPCRCLALAELGFQVRIPLHPHCLALPAPDHRRRRCILRTARKGTVLATEAVET